MRHPTANCQSRLTFYCDNGRPLAQAALASSFSTVTVELYAAALFGDLKQLPVDIREGVIHTTANRSRSADDGN